MNRQYFGTDGVRGSYGGPIINESFSARLGTAVGRWLKTKPKSGAKGPVMIGRDTRLSGESLEKALASGLAAEGWAVVSLGVLPTPAVAHAVRKSGAALGVMVTASHNPASDNGIKLFGPDGRKLTDENEIEIERLLPAEAGINSSAGLNTHSGFGNRAPETDAIRDYIATASSLLSPGALRGWQIVLDTAQGSTCLTSPAVFASLGAELVQIGNSPDGQNINDGVGSEHPESLCAAVRKTRARLGIAHDGDGDRCVLCDELGELLDGDELMAILATHALERGELAAHTLVATMQSNLGLDAAVQAAGGRVVRASVGDRYVIERMAAEGATLGGESSGHIVFSAFSTTGDGLFAALKVIAVMQATGRPLSELRRRMVKFPQATATLDVREKKPLDGLLHLQAAIKTVESELGTRGRVLVRYSGTQSKLRLLVEGPEELGVRAGLERLAAAARSDLDII